MNNYLAGIGAGFILCTTAVASFYADKPLVIVGIMFVIAAGLVIGIGDD